MIEPLTAFGITRSEIIQAWTLIAIGVIDSYQPIGDPFIHPCPKCGTRNSHRFMVDLNCVYCCKSMECDCDLQLLVVEMVGHRLPRFGHDIDSNRREETNS